MKDLSRKQKTAILALLTHVTIEAAAREAGVGERTVHRWLTQPAFSAAYREAQRKAFSQAVGRLQHMSTAAASTLGKIMTDPRAPAASRVRAARCVLDVTAKGLELEDLGARLAALERAEQIKSPKE